MKFLDKTHIKILWIILISFMVWIVIKSIVLILIFYNIHITLM